MLKELFSPHKDLHFCVQTFGDISNPAVILIVGAAAQGILWNRKLCEDIAKEGYFVIRFDNRDTGLSSGVNFETHPYNMLDMGEDVLGILAYFNIEKAHFVGMSMGGFITQFIAIHYPEKILSMTLFMTTINSLPMRGVRGIHNLPGQDLEVVKSLAELQHAPRSNLEEKVKNLLDFWRLFNGSKAKFNEEEWLPLAYESYERAKSKNAVKNHRLAILNSVADRTELLKNIARSPTLIIHGEEDALIKLAHANYSHYHLAGSKLVVIKKMGHLLTSEFTSQIQDELLAFFRGV